MENIRIHTQFDFEAPEVLANPYPTYAQLRAKSPVHWHEQTGGWLVSRHADVLECVHNPDISNNRIGPFLDKLPVAIRENFSRWPLLLDPPDHTMLRKLIAAAFAPRPIAALRPKIQAVADELLQTALDRNPTEMDLVHDFAYPLPIIVIAQMLGVDRRDRDRLKDWSDKIAAFFGASSKTAKIIEDTNLAVLSMEDYFAPVLQARRTDPQPDLISALLQAEVEGERLTDPDLLAICAMLIFGGHETTTNLIANSMLTLIRHPEQLATLRANLDLIPMAVKEVLRFEPPVQRIGRMTLKEMVIGTQLISAGQMVYLILASANRDEAQFSEPDQFDIMRRDGKHISFGNGIHYCLGATLGTLEAELALECILRRLDKVTVTRPLAWKANLSFRALEALHLGFELI